MHVLQPAIQQYDWGDYHFIPAFLNIQETKKPYAELWYGTHEQGETYLPSLKKTLRNHLQKPLPYLLKVLSARIPLSIQVHPTKAEAETGFQKEEKAQLPRNAPQRNYRDANHKPEILVALTDVWALSSFRRIEEIIQFLTGLEIPHTLINEQDLLPWLRSLLLREHDESLEKRIEAYAEMHMQEKYDVHWWALQAAALYPEDIGIIMPYLLNLVHLGPGEALFNQAGELHAYLQGAGVELMASSDNVLRGAWTTKHRDIEELCNIASFVPREPSIIHPNKTQANIEEYKVPVDDFLLYRVNGETKLSWELPSEIGIVLCTDGRMHIRNASASCMIGRGGALLCTSSEIFVEGSGELFIATHAMHLD